MEESQREELREKRRYFFNNHKKRTLIYKGDKRILGNRLCSLCGEQLSKTMSNGKGVCVRDHHVMDMHLYKAYFCRDSKICTKNLKKRGESK